MVDQKTLLPNNLPTKSSCRSIPEYFELYNGEELEIHYRFAHIITVCCICFIYGPGIPIVFPIALVGFILMYHIERYQIAYHFKRPPRFQYETLSSAVANILWTCRFYALFGWWMYSNK